MDVNQPIVLDNGSHSLKVGYAGEEVPQAVIPTLVGTPKHRRALPGTRGGGGGGAGATADGDGGPPIDYALPPPSSPIGGGGGDGSGGGGDGDGGGGGGGVPLPPPPPPPPPRGGRYVGTDAAAARGVLRLSWPMTAGAVASWPDMEALWTAAVVGVLGADPAAHPLLLTEAAGSSRGHRRALVGAALEALGAPRVYVGLPPVLALYATGRLGGVGVDVGDTVTQVVPVVDGYVVAGGVRRVDLGGRDVTTRLVGLLRKSGHSFATTAEREVVREMKEACCYVAANPRLDTFVSLAAAPPTVYTLPDGQEIPLTAERSLAPEALFTPSLAGSESPGLPALIAEAVDASPLDARRRLWSSVLLSGGSTLYRGFGGRLLGDLAARTRPSVRVRVAAPAERRYLPFIGGSLVANLSTFRGMCVGAAEWREEGERVLFKKTFAGTPF